MYFNPFFYLTVSFTRIQNLYSEWVRSTMLWVGTATLAAAAGIRNLSRHAEES